MKIFCLLRNFFRSLLLFGLVILASCGGGGGGGAPTGSLNMLLTDSPACGYDHVYVTVDHIEISPNGSSWTPLAVTPGMGRIDLLNLTNGALMSLGRAPLTVGTYQQVRLVLKANGSSAPFANAVVLTGSGTETALTTPSGQQSGYKILGPFTVQAGTMVDLVLDFNACKSIVVAGASGQYLLKPVVTAVATLVSGSITGTTTPGAMVFAEQQSSSGPVIVKGTVADATTGAFTLSPILDSADGGPVDVVMVSPSSTNLGTQIVTDVPIVAGGNTALGTFTPAASTINTASGTVLVAGVAGAANIVETQTVSSSARTYEMGTTMATTGPYSVSLAATGPWTAAYTATLPISAFTQDTNAADVGIYSLTATDAAGTVVSNTANVSAGLATVNFSLTP